MPDPTGSPIDDELARIREWPHDDPLGWFAFIKGCWWMAEWGWTEYGTEIGDGGISVTPIAISTGGWSGNEEIIGVMRQNNILWSLTWQEHRRGGHYKFAVEAAHGS